MGNWRAMGSATRRRQGAPSYHGGGAMLDRPEESIAEAKAGEQIWAKEGTGKSIHDLPDGGFFSQQKR